MADDNVTVGEDGVTPVEPAQPPPPRVQVFKDDTSGKWGWQRFDENGLLVESSGKTRTTLKQIEQRLRKGDALEGVGDDEPSVKKRG